MEQVQWEEVQPILSRQPAQQVAFAQYVVNIGAVQGGVINLAAPGERAGDLVRPRSQPPYILPRRVAGFVDREQEQRVVGQTLARDQVVDVHGPHGIGKTALISQMMHALIPAAFPDGIVYLSGRSQARDDVLQDLFECFYETASGGRVKVRPNEVRRYLAGKRALIAVDDCDDLEEGDAEMLSQAAPQSALLITGRGPQAWDGAGVSLSCLPRAGAITLLERYWGQPLGEDPETAEAICCALGDVPLSIVKAARAAAARGVSLSELRRELEAQAKTEEHEARDALALDALLSGGEQQVLSALAAPGGDSVDRPALIAIAALPAADVDRHLARLVDLGLVRTERGRYRLDEAVRPEPGRDEPDAATRARAAGYYGALAARLQATLPDPDEANVLSALRHYVGRRQWREVIQIARALEPRLATSGHWGQWRRVLHAASEAARQAGDGAAEAWAHNQLGVVALGAADPVLARQFFQRALRGWLALGDHDGATIARWNLRVLLGPPPPPTRGSEPRPSPAAGPSPLVLTLVAATAVLRLGLGLVASLLAGDGTPVAVVPTVEASQALPPVGPTQLLPTATATLSPTVATPVPAVVTVVTVVTRVPRPPTAVPPRPQAWLELTLAGGCGQTYPPGGVLGIRMQSNVNGTAAVYLRDPGGRRELLFRQPLSVNRVASNSWPVPNLAGRWVLEGRLDNGPQAPGCAFVVEGPVITVWLESKGCDTAYEPGSLQVVAYRANVDGNVRLYLPWWCGGEKCDEAAMWHSDTVRAGETGRVEWYVPYGESEWILLAELNDGQASGQCVVYLSTPPSIGEIWFESEMRIQGVGCYDEVTVYAQVSDREDGIARVELRTRPSGSNDDWSSVDMVPGANDIYSQRVVARGEPFLEYQIYAEDNRGASATSGIQALDVTLCVTTVPPEVVTTVPPEVVTTVPPEVTTAVPFTVTTETPTVSPTPTTPVPPTDTSTPQPDTPAPVPPTDTPAPPTDTPIPLLPTDTPLPPTTTPTSPPAAPDALPHSETVSASHAGVLPAGPVHPAPQAASRALAVAVPRPHFRPHFRSPPLTAGILARPLPRQPTR
ncbi:MAG TPA: NB-ARC domain-containing protein [Anaerolineae bacterium]|nr:NB-ARC domain-containing protein [Anaerolineae bacterium]